MTSPSLAQQPHLPLQALDTPSLLILHRLGLKRDPSPIEDLIGQKRQR